MTRDERSAPISPKRAPPGTGSLPRRNDEGREGPPRGVYAMAVVRWALVALMAVIAALSVSYSFGLSASGSVSEAVRYYCPMHPQVVQDHPGECPICSMTLVEKEHGSKAPSNDAPNTAQGGEPEAPANAMGNPAHTHGASPLPAVPGLVPIELGLDRVQNIGVRTAAAVLDELRPELRAVGFISAEEDRLARVHTRFSGWIEQLEVATTGQKVARGQVLAGLYNLELLPAEQEFLASIRWSAGRASSASKPAGLGDPIERDARARLELFGLSPAEIDRIAATGKPIRTVAVTAPISGHVTSKNAVRGAFVEPGTELFEIADLSKVWVLVDVYEYDLGRVRLGQAADITVGAFPGQRFSGKLSFIYPMIDPSTRTLRVRVELDNRDMKLRPGMYAVAMIRLDPASGTLIPAEALVDTGEHQYVFVTQPGGRFEPRPVQVGDRVADRVQIIEGLAPGEVVVTTANFLIDSESRLRGAIQGTSERPGTRPQR
jgi:Cu(I)/Ag(I) efflux system membrane fusion protein